MSAIFSLQVEKHTLGGIIKFPELFGELAPFISETTFYDEVHSTIFLIIKSCYERNIKWDKVLLAEKIKNLGVSFKSEINIYDYIDNLSYIPITQAATVEAARELAKLKVRRDLVDMAKRVEAFVRQNGNMPLDDIVSNIDAIYGEKVSVFEPEKKPENLYGGIEEQVEERGNNPVEETGLKTHHAKFNEYFGGLKPQEIYAFGSRPGQGKSTMLEDLAVNTCLINKTKAFVCDTEMSTENIRWRAAAAKSGIPQWYIETGQWRKNPQMVTKVRAALKEIKQLGDQNIVTHFQVGDKTLDQVISFIRRWHHKNVKKGEPSIIVYDYLKLTLGENVEKNWGEYQVLGEKINKLKRLAEELNCVILTAIQLNRSGDNFNKKKGAVFADDSTAIAISDRLQWLAAFVAIFRTKTIDEITLDGPEFGTHVLIPLKTRYQGKNAQGFNNLVKRVMPDGSVAFIFNYLNYDVQNFKVEERGSVHDIVKRDSHVVKLDDKNPNDGDTL